MPNSNQIASSVVCRFETGTLIARSDVITIQRILMIFGSGKFVVSSRIIIVITYTVWGRGSEKGPSAFCKYFPGWSIKVDAWK